MKTINTTIGAFVVAWRLSAYGLDGEHYNANNYDKFSKVLKKVLKTKFFAAVDDEKGDRHFLIFDTEDDRLDWLSQWIDENPDSNCGTVTYKYFKKHTCDDFYTLYCYSLLADSSGVIFTL